MLSRYRKILVEEYANKRISLIKNSTTIQSLQKADRVIDDIAKNLNKAKYVDAAASLVKGILSVFTKRKSTQFDLQHYFIIYDSISRELAEAKRQVSLEEESLQNLIDGKKGIGVFNFTEKKEANNKIQQQKEALEEKKQLLKMTEGKLQQLKELLPDAMAIKSDVNNYEKRLIAIEEKYC